MGRERKAQLYGVASSLAVLGLVFLCSIQPGFQDGVGYAITYIFCTLLCLLACGACLDMALLSPADSYDIQHMLIRYGRMIASAYTMGWYHYEQFKKRAAKPVEAQENTLRWILDMNSNTAYGRDHQLSSIRCRDDLVTRHPLTAYSHYEPYTERVARGEKNVMTKADIAILALSSGTTGNNKRLPYTMTYLKRFAYEYLAHLYSQARFYRQIGLKRVFQYRIFHPSSVNQYGVTEGGIGNVVGLPDIYNLTPPCFLKASTESVSFLIQAVFVLTETEMGNFEGYSSDLWFSFFKFISTNKKLICDIIDSGVFPPHPGMEDELRWEVNKYMKSNTERARELRVLLDGPREGLVKRVWPGLVAIGCAKAGGFAHSAQLLEDTYFMGIPLVIPAHMATEGPVGILLNDGMGSDIYVFAIHSVFFEFIHVDNMEEENPPTLFIDQLEVGQLYEVVMTNADGLYRNRFGDVVQIVGYWGKVPKYKFMYRTGQILNLAFDRTPETTFHEALTAATGTWEGLEVLNYAATESTHLEGIGVECPAPGHYVAFMEVLEDGELAIITDQQAAKLDESLYRYHETYEQFRKSGNLGPARIVQVKLGTFCRLRELLCGGMTNMQFKQPRVLRKPNALKLLWESRVD